MKFMHIADVHLGAQPDAGYLWAKDRGREIWDSFRKCIDDANRRQVDLLLIAGDLFHAQPTIQELREVNRLFASLEHAMVVMIAGNHDYLRPGSAYLNFPWNKNVICMFGTQCECVRISQLHTEIYGFSYHQQENPNPEYDDLKPAKSDNFKILLAHGGDAKHIPISKEKLASLGFDYIALGHIHKPQTVIKNKAVFSGALEPIDPNDTGAHGYIVGEVRHKKLQLSFVKAAYREYKVCEVALTSEDSAYTIREKIAAKIQQEGTQHIYKIQLTGNLRAQMNLNLQELQRCGRIIEVVDATAPALQIAELRRQYAGELIGRYIDSFGNAAPDSVEGKALRYGLEALLYGK